MRINADAARAYFAHKSQQAGGFGPDDLHDNGLIYYAEGPICGLFHYAGYPGVFMAHYGVKPEGWGHLVEPAKAVLNEAFTDLGAVRLVGWTLKSNRQAIAFARRLGFTVDGEFPIPGDTIIMQGWTQWA